MITLMKKININRVIDLKSVVKIIYKHIWSFLLIICFFVVLSIVQQFRLYQGNIETIEQYSKEIEEYNIEIDSLKEQIQQLQYYYDSSIQEYISPNSSDALFVTVTVVSPNNDFDDKTRAILKEMSDIDNLEIEYDKLSETTGIPELMIKELMRIKNVDSCLYIEVYNSNEKNAETVFNFVIESETKKFIELTNKLGCSDYELKELDRHYSKGMAQEEQVWMTSVQKTIEILGKKRSELKVIRNELQNKVKTMSFNFRDCINRSVIVSVIVALFLILLLIAYLSFDNSVLSVNEFVMNYGNKEIIDVSKNDLFLEIRKKQYKKQNDGSKKLCVISDNIDKGKELSKLLSTKQLPVKYIDTNYLNEDVLKKISSFDGAIMYVKTGKTKYDEIDRDIKLLNDILVNLEMIIIE